LFHIQRRPPLHLVKRSLAYLLLSLVMLSSLQAAEKKHTVVDQLNKTVILPVEIKRAVILQHHTLDIAIQLGAAKQIVGTLNNWKQLIPDAASWFPGLDSLRTPGDLNNINLEELAALKPDVVFVTHYAPQKMIEQIEALGIPVLGISLFRDDAIEPSRFNPDLQDPDKAYTLGLEDTIRLVGSVFGKEKRAEELIAETHKNRNLILDRTKKLADSQRPSVLMLNPQLNTYGTGRYTGVIIERAGGINAARNEKGYLQVNMEQILAWNPDVIIVQDRYASLAEDIQKDPAWKGVKAISNKQVFVSPEFVKPWGYPCPESFVLGELWLAKKLYPKMFSDIDLKQYVETYYQKFYGITYSGPF